MGNVTRAQKEIDDIADNTFNPEFWHQKAVDSAKRMIEERSVGGEYFHRIFADEVKAFAALAQSAGTAAYQPVSVNPNAYATTSDGTL
jgi:hypothetical protein